VPDRDLSAKHKAREAAKNAKEGKGGVETARGIVVESGDAAAGVGERDLSNEQTQQEILEPKPAELTVGGKPVKLYPLPGRASRDFVVLFGDILVAFNESQLKLSPAMRMGRVVHEDFGDEVTWYAARSEYEPGAEIPAADVLKKRAAEICEDATFEELAALVDAMVTLNRVKETFGIPKSQPGSPTPTS
jgi:hypothetical protein